VTFLISSLGGTMEFLGFYLMVLDSHSRCLFVTAMKATVVVEAVIGECKLGKNSRASSHN
jgi:hypothetical protein